MSKFKLSEAAKEILNLREDSKSTFDSNISSKRASRGSEGTQGAMRGSVGIDKLPASTVAGQKDAGMIGQSPERALTDDLPDYLKGTPQATPPGVNATSTAMGIEADLTAKSYGGGGSGSGGRGK